MKLLAFAALAAAVLPCFGQQNAPQRVADPQAAIRSTTQEVLLDVVVRDKKGRLVKDLSASDFEVSDDGAGQQLRSFRLVTGPDAAPPSTEPVKSGVPAAATVDPLRQVRLVTLAFDRLGPDGRNNIRQAVTELLKAEMGPNVFFAVFSIDQRLSVLQQYTADKELVRKAVAKVTATSSSLYKSESDQIEEELKTIAVQNQANATVATPANAAPNGGALAAAAMAQMTLNMLQFTQTLDRTLQGRSTIFALWALIKEQYRLPGRKTLLYFSEGLVVPPEYKDEFDGIIGTANRANVSVYGIDARGLVTNRQNDVAGELLTQSTSSTRSMQAQRVGPVTRDQATAGDRADEAIRQNSQNALADISEKTGGFLIANTNDLRSNVRRVSEDIDTHYELSYSPAIDKFDGHFRKVSVHVNRADVRIQTRSGYYALPFIEGQTLMPYEMPLLSALSATPLPRAIPFRSAALHFQTPSGSGASAVVIDVPLEGIEFVSDELHGSYQLHFSVLAIYKNASGEVLQKLSQDVPQKGPLDKLDGFKKGHFIYTRYVELPPGRYTLETALFDRQAGKVSAKKASVIVPPPSNGVAISSLALVRGLAPGAVAEDAADPFEFTGGKVTPSLDDTVKAGPGANLSLYFTVYPVATSPTPPELAIEFLQDGKPVGRGEPKLPAADKWGRIPYIAASSIESLKPGQYEIRATVTQDHKAASERALITVEQ